MLNENIRQMIETRFKAKIKYSQQCEALAMDIEESTGKPLSTTTLKRMLGFVNGSVQPRLSSLDILAEYLGYPNYQLLTKDFDKDSEISEFKWVNTIESADLQIGEQLQITYDPNRMLILSYLGDNQYLVNESHGSKLIKGDKLRILAFYLGFELIVTNVERAGKSLGIYRMAKQNGITGIKIL